MADEKVTATEDSGENFAEMFKASQENAQGRVKQGDKVTGTVIDVTDDSVFVNVGVKIDGIMDRKDFIDNEGNLTVKVGDEVEAYVTKATSQEIVLSRSMNGAGMAAIENAKDTGIPVEGRVIDACKGGYHVEILGKTAFCPGSQMAAGEPESLPGQTFQPGFDIRLDGFLFSGGHLFQFPQNNMTYHYLFSSQMGCFSTHSPQSFFSNRSRL